MQKSDISSHLMYYRQFHLNNSIHNFLYYLYSNKDNELKNDPKKLSDPKDIDEYKKEEDSELFEEKMKRLTSELAMQMEEGKKLDIEIKKNLEGIGYGF